MIKQESSLNKYCLTSHKILPKRVPIIAIPLKPYMAVLKIMPNVFVVMKLEIHQQSRTVVTRNALVMITKRVAEHGRLTYFNLIAKV